ncbi:hypothetical protein GPL15_04535 [Clostridium sp. MCC353]|uniref:hypothetical protein n=1 Tax=Clostridium sp. MCC353 TaxID=2592646 RepID=UPI001C021491|nr:hypothetical protein [Clostridium sp. MCC353]MBT9775778.1 hypothetical protein [Clostridium sp. MCC353]
MGRSRNRKNRGLSDDEMRRYLKFMIIPFIVILLIIVIVLTDKSSKTEKETTAESATTSISAADETTQPVEPDTKEYVQNFEEYELKKDEIPEIKALIEAYCQAKTECDPEALARVFGQTLSPEELEQERAKLEKTAQVVEGYENIISYTKNGLTEDTYVVYPYYEIKFKDAETPLPVLTMCYVQKNAEGQYVMTLDFDDSVADYISKVNVSEDVRLLSSQVDAQVQEAIANDPALNSIYNGIESGSPSEEESQTGGEDETSAPEGQAEGGQETEGETEAQTEPVTEMDIQIETTAAQ